MKQKHPLVSYQYYEEKNILKYLKQNRGAVSLQHNESVPKNSFPEFWTFSDSVSYYLSEGVFIALPAA